MLSGWGGALATLLCLAPGWLALVCWRLGRGVPGLNCTPADCLLSLVLSAAWLGLLASAWMALSLPMRIGHAATATVLLPPLACLTLLAAPAALGWVAGRLARRVARPESVRVSLQDDTTVYGLRDPARCPAHAEILTDAICERAGVRSLSPRVEIPRAQITVIATVPRAALVLPGQRADHLVSISA